MLSTTTKLGGPIVVLQGEPAGGIDCPSNPSAAVLETAFGQVKASDRRHAPASRERVKTSFHFLIANRQDGDIIRPKIEGPLPRRLG